MYGIYSYVDKLPSESSGATRWFLNFCVSIHGDCSTSQHPCIDVTISKLIKVYKYISTVSTGIPYQYIGRVAADPNPDPKHWRNLRVAPEDSRGSLSTYITVDTVHRCFCLLCQDMQRHILGVHRKQRVDTWNKRKTASKSTAKAKNQVKKSSGIKAVIPFRQNG